MIGNHIETPLHITAMLGHMEFMDEVLARKAELAREKDSQRSTPLHLAAAKWYLNIVVSLLRASPEICFVRDKYERNHLHVAAMKDHMDVLEFLVRARPDAARSIIEHGQTILHLCVKHNRPEALKLLIDILGDDRFINSTEEYGDTICHLVDADRQTKTIVFLINKGVNPNITNSRGFTALGLLAQDESAGSASEIKVSVPQTLGNRDPFGQPVYANNQVAAFQPPVREEDERERKRKWQKGMHKTLMVVAILLATMAFQASIAPPGGLWQDDSEDKEDITDPHTAGESIMADKYPLHYKYFVTCKTISFVASLSIIMLLLSGLPLKQRRITTWIAMLTLWVAITFTATAYAISINVFSPGSEMNTSVDGRGALLAWFGLMALLFLCHLVCLILKLVRKVLKFVPKASTERRPELQMGSSQKKRPEP